jgi:hypothetical protein
MASDFTVAWQFFSKRTIVFFVTDQTPHPSQKELLEVAVIDQAEKR